MKIFKTILFVLLAVCQTALFAQVKVGDTFSAWSEGYLDIHHINSGRGEPLCHPARRNHPDDRCR